MSLLAPESPGPVSAEFGVSFVEAAGGRRSEPLPACWIVPFEEMFQVRAFASYRGKMTSRANSVLYRRTSASSRWSPNTRASCSTTAPSKP